MMDDTAAVIQTLGANHLELVARLVKLAFGGPDQPSERLRRALDMGAVVGVADPAGHVVATATLQPYQQMIVGCPVTMIGLAGVTVSAEARGARVGSRMLAALVPELRERGAAVSALFPSTPRFYRRAGWESAGVVASIAMPAAHLIDVPPDGSTRVRLIDRQDPAGDVAAVAAAYARMVRSSTGPLTRTGPMFDPLRVLDNDEVVLAESGDGVAGYLAYSRPSATRIVVHDLVGDAPGVLSALLRVLGGWASMGATVELRAGDVSRLDPLLPVRVGTHQVNPWMLRIVDLPRATSERGWTTGVSGSVDLDLRDPLGPWQDGRWRLEVDSGGARISRGGAGDVRVDVRGLAALYTGWLDTNALRTVGLIDGDGAAVGVLDRLFAGPRPYMLDSF